MNNHKSKKNNNIFKQFKVSEMIDFAKHSRNFFSNVSGIDVLLFLRK